MLLQSAIGIRPCGLRIEWPGAGAGTRIVRPHFRSGKEEAEERRELGPARGIYHRAIQIRY